MLSSSIIETAWANSVDKNQLVYTGFTYFLIFVIECIHIFNYFWEFHKWVQYLYHFHLFFMLQLLVYVWHMYVCVYVCPCMCVLCSYATRDDDAPFKSHRLSDKNLSAEHRKLLFKLLVSRRVPQII